MIKQHLESVLKQGEYTVFYRGSHIERTIYQLFTNYFQE